ncbi:putative ferric-chelate reductase 1 [Clarias gariepinus]
MHHWLFVLLATYTLSSVHAYRDGSIAPACDSMTPAHTNYVPQNTTAPYRVTVDRRTCRPGDMITVTLETVDSTKFIGFMLQARPASGKSAVGSFMTETTSLVRLHNCFNNKDSAISHSGENELTQIKFMWTAPPTPAPDNIVLCATFVKSFPEFWTMVSSPTILLSDSPAPTVNCLMMAFCILIALGHFRSTPLPLL